MTDILEKCARALCVANDLDPDAPQVVGDASSGKFWEFHVNEAIAVIDALADGVTIEMGVALERALSDGDGGRDLSGNYKLRALSAAIRAAKSREG